MSDNLNLIIKQSPNDRTKSLHIAELSSPSGKNVSLLQINNSLNLYSTSSSLMTTGQPNNIEINETNGLCAMCGCGQTGILAQGKLSKFKATNHFNNNNLTNLRNFLLNSASAVIDGSPNKQHNKQSKIKTTILIKIGVKFIANELLAEINKIGWQMENLKTSDVFEIISNDSSSFFVHTNCYLWSFGIGIEVENEEKIPINVDKIVFESFTRRCNFCNLYGASVKCCISECQEIYHYPCALLVGCFHHSTSLKMLCPTHIEQAVYLFDTSKCLLCDTADRLNELLTCATCGSYFHSSCLSLPVDLVQNPMTRFGWQCPECKCCQICKQFGDDGQMIVCESCDKSYHVYCCRGNDVQNLNSGFKCDQCRRELCLTRACVTCKNLLSRDALPDGVCENCKKISLSGQNQHDNLSSYKKRSVKDLLQMSRVANQTIIAGSVVCTSPDSSSSPSRSPLVKKEYDNIRLMPESSHSTETENLAKSLNQTNKPIIGTKKKQISKKNNRNIKRSNSSTGTQMSMRSTRSRTLGKDPKCDNAKKMSSIADSSASNIDDSELNRTKKTNQNDEPTIGHVKRDEDEHHAVTVISSLDDSFSLKQDMCLNCGSFGRGEDGQVVSCSQCGQCFHSYCAGMNTITKVILERGWRCLDCTVCEGCGKATDEALLILCDDCDISYHIYCLDPPLDQVPKGNWKCKWCVKCLKCGAKSPGTGSKGKTYEWMNNYTECAHCYSLSVCHVCSTAYKESELIVKCLKCDRWSHANCKSHLAEEEIERRFMAQGGFVCSRCDDEEKVEKEAEKEKVNFIIEDHKETLHFLEQLANLSKRGILDDGIYLTDAGSELIKKVKIKPLPCARRNRQLRSTNTNPDIDQPKHDKHMDDNSRSSSEEKTETNEDHSRTNPELDPTSGEPKKTTSVSKRHINFGMGGFNLKFRSRIKTQQLTDYNDTNINNENENKTVKRKKKSSYEEMIPVYMQEAFFGVNTLQTCKNVDLENESINLDSEKYERVNKMTNNDHQINLDENMLKLAQQNRKAHLELGIDDFLDGDIVSYLFNDNRNLMEFNTEQDLSNNKTRSLKDNYDEKMFDDKIYEDIFHHIVSDGPKNSNSVDDYLNLNTQNMADFDTNEPTGGKESTVDSLVSQPTHHHTSLSKSGISPNHQKASVSTGVEAITQSTATTTGANTTAPSLKIITQNGQLLDSTMQGNQTNVPAHVQLIAVRQQQHQPTSTPSPSQQQQQQTHSPNTFNYMPLDVSKLNEINQNRQIDDLARQIKESTYTYKQNSESQSQPQQQQLININQTYTGEANSGGPVMLNPNQQSGATYSMIVEPAQPTPATPVNHETSFSSFHDTSTGQLSLDDAELSNDCQMSKVGGDPTLLDISKHKKMLEKYAEDEELGDWATQAMPLYSNLNFPNLRNEIKDVNERYKYIHKIWRKLDSQVKLVFINKSRQNRYKKKSDDKTTSGLSVKINSTSAGRKPKSPSNSDKQSEPDNYSRSQTPSISMDDTNDACSSSKTTTTTTTTDEPKKLLHFAGDVAKQEFIYDKNMQPIAILNPGSNTISPLPVQFVNQQTQQPQQPQKQQQPSPIVLYQIPNTAESDLAEKLKQHQQQQQQQDANKAAQNAKQEKITIKNYLSNQLSSSIASNASQSATNAANSSPSPTLSNPNLIIDNIMTKSFPIAASLDFQQQQQHHPQPHQQYQPQQQQQHHQQPQLKHQQSQHGSLFEQSNIRILVNPPPAAIPSLDKQSTQQQQIIIDPQFKIYDQNASPIKFISCQTTTGDANQTLLIKQLDKPPELNESKIVQLKLQPIQTSLGGSEATMITSVKCDDVIGDHIDSIINEVAAGSGTIPYSIDGDDDETNSSFKEFLQSQCDSMDLNTSLTKSIGNESNDGKKASKKAKSSTTSSSSASGSNKIINQLMNAAAKTEDDASKMMQSEAQKQTKKRKQPNKQEEQSTNESSQDNSNHQQTVLIKNVIGEHQLQQIPLIKNDYVDTTMTSLIKPVVTLRNNSSPVKINELLMLNQNYSLTTGTSNLAQQQQHQQQQSNASNFYIIQPSTTSNVTPVKNICKDENLKKMLSDLGDDDDDDDARNDLCLKKNILTKHGGNFLPQLDGTADEQMDEKPISSSSSSSSISNRLANTKVVINHELLNSYGITLNPTTNETKYTKPPYVAGYEPTQTYPPTTNPQQQQQPPAAQTNVSSKSNSIKNLISQQQLQQQQQQQQQQQHVEDAEFNYHQAVIQPQPQPQQPQQQPPPKVNGDNILLKALLQTAPKNAPSMVVVPQSPTVPVVSPAPAAAAAALVPIISTPVQSSSPISRQKSNNSSTGGSSSKKQQKLMNDLKNKIIESSSTEQQPPSNRMKINTILENNKKRKNETAPQQPQPQQQQPQQQPVTVSTPADRSTQFGLVQHMSQPTLNILESLSIPYPEKEHAELVKSTFNFQSGGRLFNLDVRLIDMENEFLKWALFGSGSFNHTSDGDVAQFVNGLKKNRSLKRKLQQTFRICSSRLDKPVSVHEAALSANRPLVEDSSKRLNDSLERTMTDDELSTSMDEVCDDSATSASTVVEEYFRKSNDQVGLYVNVSSPLIDVDNSNKFVPDSDFRSGKHNGDTTTPVTFKVSAQASAELRSTIEKLSEILCIDIPKQVDLGRCVLKPIEDDCGQTPTLTSSLSSSSNLKRRTATAPAETAYSLQSLNGRFNTCKFCDAFIDVNDDKENCFVHFCSDYCKSSYKKILFVRQNRRNLKLVQTPTSPNFKFQLEVESASSASAISPNDEVKARRRAATLASGESSFKFVFRWSVNQVNQIISRLRSVDHDARERPLFESIRPAANEAADKRACIFCQLVGDQDSNGCSRLLSIDVDKWCHLNCALWSDEVYETMSGSLMNVDIAFKNSMDVSCSLCNLKGATLKCFAPKCNANYHFPCAVKDKCAFNQDKTVFCSTHASRGLLENRLSDLSVFRNVWIERDEVAQIQSFMSRDVDENHYAIRIGSLVLDHIGQLLPHQLASGHYNNRDYIYPVGYKATRFYWSASRLFKRARYVCCVNEHESCSRPEFSVTIIESDGERVTLVDKSPGDLWKKILDRLETLRRESNANVMKIFPQYFSGEYMFGLAEPHIIRLVESLPGVETLTNYVFKFGRLQLLDMPLTINPTGSARSEPKLRTFFRKSHTLTCNTQRNNNNNNSSTTATSSSTASTSTNFFSQTSMFDEDSDSDENEDAELQSDVSSSTATVSYTKQFVFSKSTQIKKLKGEWRNNVYLAKSQIQVRRP